jgi:hypothetical protein
MQSPSCNGDPATTVWCHSNHSEHGKGVGLKAHDIFGFYGCSACHRWYDEDSKFFRVGPEVREHYFRRAHDTSLLRLVQKGVLK